jgi:hypothetical protein
MENFSTTGVALLPRAANLATLAVVLAATWWSGAQRPDVQPALARTGTTDLAAAQKPQPEAVPAAATGAAHWPSQATPLPRDGLQAVGYTPRMQR